MNTLIKNGEVVTGEGTCIADLLISNGIIERIGEGLSCRGARVIDAQGCYVMPGAIDVHTHFDCEAAAMVADDFETGTRAAILGGTTTIIDFAEQEKSGTLKQAVREWDEKSKGKCHTDYSYHMTICDWNESVESEIEDMMDVGITSFKLFMAYEDMMLRDDEIFKIVKRIGDMGGVVCVHCENGPIIDCLRSDAIKKGCTGPQNHPLTRPAQTEREAVSRLCAIASIAGARVYVVHLSSKEGLEEVERAREAGVDVIAETCPQYLLLDESLYSRKYADPFEGAKYVISPPLRSKESCEALWKGLSQGTIDVVATDHCAFNYRVQKEIGRGDFTSIPNGAPGVENRFKLMYTYGVQNGKMDISGMVEVISENPAKIFGLYPKMGAIMEGSDADIVVFNPNPRSVIRASAQAQNVDYNIYEGFEQQGRFEYIFLRGKLKVDGEKLIDQKPGGKYLKRSARI